MNTHVGKYFSENLITWKMVKPIITLFKIESTDKDDTDWIMETYFLVTFSQFKEGSWHIDEIKVPEWMDAKVKTIEIDISNDNRPKMAKIGDYWSEEQTKEIVDLLKEFQDVFVRDYKDLKGLVK